MVAALFVVILDGQVIAGASVSFTVTVNEHAVLFPDASVTTNVLVVTPNGNVDPDGNPTVCVVTAPAQLSVPTGAT